MNIEISLITCFPCQEDGKKKDGRLCGSHICKESVKLERMSKMS